MACLIRVAGRVRVIWATMCSVLPRRDWLRRLTDWLVVDCLCAQCVAAGASRWRATRATTPPAPTSASNSATPPVSALHPVQPRSLTDLDPATCDCRLAPRSDRGAGAAARQRRFGFGVGLRLHQRQVGPHRIAKGTQCESWLPHFAAAVPINLAMSLPWCLRFNSQLGVRA